MADDGESLKSEIEALRYSIAHDLRAPLRIITGFSEALSQDYRDKLDADGVEYVQRIHEAAERMEAMINAVLELSRVARAELQSERVDVTEMAGSIAVSLKASDPGRVVHFSIEPGLSVNADPVLFRIVLQQIMSNAWKFTGRRSAARIEVGREERGERRLLFVRDDGAGFDQAYAGRMFTLFQRFHSEGEFPGLGAGLALVKRIVARHGGTVWAVGHIDRGATVYIDLE